MSFILHQLYYSQSNRPSKRRRATANQPFPEPPIMDDSPLASSATPAGHIPKRGARACITCRKGKNRCKGEVSLIIRAVRSRYEARLLSLSTAPARKNTTTPCRRSCVFEKPDKKTGELLSTASVECAHSPLLFLSYFSHPFFLSQTPSIPPRRPV